MPKIRPFEEHTTQYESWFTRHELTYQSELAAVQEMIPDSGKGIEIGIGSGRFAAPFNIRYGIEPSYRMIRLAARRGVCVARGMAEYLPILDGQFDFALMVTTICFLDDVGQALREAYRILKPGGLIIIGFVDKNSRLGKLYEKNRLNNVFYRDATFFSVDEVINHLNQAGFGDFVMKQTVFQSLDQMVAVNPVEPGYGKGSFVVIKAKKRS
ncbi:MAG TPA: class I SAM-dependent methyltransferase [Candidatus Marinimicrobia bacterium]|nr:class I SAM-dependent methyltransferase [Candidatus Neomarinimicrobiota bacterium]